MANQLVRHKAAGLVCGLVLVLLGVGCSTTQAVNTPGGVSTLNTLAQGRTVTLTFTDGAQIQALNLQIGPDSVSWFNPNSGLLMQESTNRVVDVQIVSRSRGALEGAGIGAGIGAGVLAALVTFSYEPCSAFICPGPSSRAGWTVLGAVAGAFVGALPGMAVGSSVGSRRIYQIEPTGSPPRIAASSSGD